MVEVLGFNLSTHQFCFDNALTLRHLATALEFAQTSDEF
jgi:hypothetical protein